MRLVEIQEAMRTIIDFSLKNGNDMAQAVIAYAPRSILKE